MRRFLHDFLMIKSTLIMGDDRFGKNDRIFTNSLIYYSSVV